MLFLPNLQLHPSGFHELQGAVTFEVFIHDVCAFGDKRAEKKLKLAKWHLGRIVQRLAG
jgi:hypothetical protein